MSSRPVELTAADGLTLRGEIWGDASDWLILAHGLGEDLDAWRPLEGLTRERGFAALALDLRGHGGSDDPWDERGAELDVEVAAAFVRAEGAETVEIVAAREGALAALRAAPRVRPDALVLLSPGPLAGASTADLRGEGVAKLVLAGTLDAQTDADAATVRAASIGWALGLGLPTEEQGAALLAGQWAVQVLEQIGAFLDEQRWAASSAALEGRPGGA